MFVFNAQKLRPSNVFRVFGMFPVNRIIDLFYNAINDGKHMSCLFCSHSIILIESRFASSTAVTTIRIIIKIFQPLHSLIEVTLQQTHLPFAIYLELTFSLLNSLLV